MLGMITIISGINSQPGGIDMIKAYAASEAGGELKSDSARRKGTTSSGASVGEGSSTGDKSV